MVARGEVAIQVCDCALGSHRRRVSVLVKFSEKYPKYGSTYILKGRAELGTWSQEAKGPRREGERL